MFGELPAELERELCECSAASFTRSCGGARAGERHLSTWEMDEQLARRQTGTVSTEDAGRKAGILHELGPGERWGQPELVGVVATTVRTRRARALH